MDDADAGLRGGGELGDNGVEEMGGGLVGGGLQPGNGTTVKAAVPIK